MQARVTNAGWLFIALAALHCKSRNVAPAPTPAPATATASAILTAPSPTRPAPSDAGRALDGAATKPEGILVPSTNRSTSFCAIFGTYPLDARASAEVGRDKIAKTGVPDVSVRETAEFGELSWGQLIVVSVAPSREEAEARRAKGSLATKGFARPCTELSGTFTATGEPAEKQVQEDSVGCLGWNPKKKSALCLLFDGSLQGGSEDTVTFLGASAEKNFLWLKTPALAFDVKVNAKTIARTKAAAAKGGYRTFADYRVRELQPGEEANWATPKFSIRYERRKRPDFVEFAGSWNDVTDTIMLQCKDEKTTLFESDIQGVDEQPVRLYWSPKDEVLLVTWHVHFAYEGNNGGFLKATMLDLASGCPKPVMP